MVESSMRDYQIVRLEISLPEESRLSERLYQFPCLGLESEAIGDKAILRAYFSGDFPLADLRQGCEMEFSSLKWLGETSIRLSNREGSERPTFEVSFGDIALRLKQAPAFGSGAHATTRLAADLLLSLPLRERSVLDVGTGSGILALLARRAGALPVDAVEILPEARENARENFLANKFSDISLFSDLSLSSGSYDVVVANILAPTLRQLRSSLLARLKPKAYLILSGILQEEEIALLQCFSSCTLLDRRSESEWVAFCLRL